MELHVLHAGAGVKIEASKCVSRSALFISDVNIYLSFIQGLPKSKVTSILSYLEQATLKMECDDVWQNVKSNEMFCIWDHPLSTYRSMGGGGVGQMRTKLY